jgi:hypothetical protein
VPEADLRRWLPVRREDAEDLGLAALEKQLAFAKALDLTRLHAHRVALQEPVEVRVER